MVILDSDHMTLIERGGEESKRITARLSTIPRDSIATTIVTYQEQTSGWFARLSHPASTGRQVFIYSQIRLQLKSYCNIAIVEFDDSAEEVFKSLMKPRSPIGTMDLKIASIAIANDATLLTRNLRDFDKVPGLKVEDWSA